MAVSKLNPVSSATAPAATAYITGIPAGLTLQQTITSSGSVTLPASLDKVFIIAIGGGGSGGGGSWNSNQGAGFSGGGGGGGAFAGWVDKFSSVTIGAGGATRTTGQIGLNGGRTQVGFILVGGGGGGFSGPTSVSASVYAAGAGTLGGSGGGSVGNASSSGSPIIIRGAGSTSLSGFSGGEGGVYCNDLQQIGLYSGCGGADG